MNPFNHWTPINFGKVFITDTLLIVQKETKRIHLFCEICNLFLRPCVKFGYHALHAKSKCGCMRVLQSILRSRRFKYFSCLYRNLSLPFTFFKTFKAISWPDRVSSKRQPRYSTVGNCLSVTSCRFITMGSALFLKFFGLQRIDLVLSSPKMNRKWVYSFWALFYSPF